MVFNVPADVFETCCHEEDTGGSGRLASLLSIVRLTKNCYKNKLKKNRKEKKKACIPSAQHGYYLIIESCQTTMK